MLTRSLFETLDNVREFERLYRDVNRLFNNIRPAGPTQFPALNVRTHENSAVITTELPGFAAADIDILVVNDTLTLKGGRKSETLKEGEVFHRQERRAGKFSRSLQLPFKVAGDQVEAEFRNGVLRITTPRAEEDKPRKIVIKSN